MASKKKQEQLYVVRALGMYYPNFGDTNTKVERWVDVTDPIPLADATKRAKGVLKYGYCDSAVSNVELVKHDRI